MQGSGFRRSLRGRKRPLEATTPRGLKPARRSAIRHRDAEQQETRN